MTTLSVAPGSARLVTLAASFTLSMTSIESNVLLTASVNLWSFDSTSMPGEKEPPPIGATGARRSLWASMTISPAENDALHVLGYYGAKLQSGRSTGGLRG